VTQWVLIQNSDGFAAGTRSPLQSNKNQKIDFLKVYRPSAAQSQSLKKVTLKHFLGQLTLR